MVRVLSEASKCNGKCLDAKFAELAKFREVEQATAKANTGVLRCAQDDNEERRAKNEERRAKNEERRTKS
jgi:hypothetical protein